VINGYFDFFELDFLVEAEKILADGYGFNPKRVLQLNNIIQYDVKWNEVKYGLERILGIYYQRRQRH